MDASGKLVQVLGGFPGMVCAGVLLRFAKAAISSTGFVNGWHG